MQFSSASNVNPPDTGNIQFAQFLAAKRQRHRLTILVVTLLPGQPTVIFQRRLQGKPTHSSVLGSFPILGLVRQVAGGHANGQEQFSVMVARQVHASTGHRFQLGHYFQVVGDVGGENDVLHQVESASVVLRGRRTCQDAAFSNKEQTYCLLSGRNRIWSPTITALN